MVISVTRLAKFLVTNPLTKVTQILNDFLERHHFEEETMVTAFWTTFVKNWATFNSTSGHTDGICRTHNSENPPPPTLMFLIQNCKKYISRNPK